MNNNDHPVLSEKGKAAADGRARRQAEALRANLTRRKAQTRARAEVEAPPCPEEGHRLKDPET